MTMAMRRVLILGLGALMVCSLLVEATNDPYISYGAMHRNMIPGCRPGKEPCSQEQPVNDYQRGCEKSKLCRDEGKDKNTDAGELEIPI
uniref:Uncharacterized protein n=1 Tax=Nelumbo nucifera TaxID=4432 RepID=A0A822YB76_NELNU|nr:TPA_asm: hypothetical protein HUJ06_030841 [Nelumbo nucifera]